MVVPSSVATGCHGRAGAEAESLSSPNPRLAGQGQVLFHHLCCLLQGVESHAEWSYDLSSLSPQSPSPQRKKRQEIRNCFHIH